MNSENLKAQAKDLETRIGTISKDGKGLTLLLYMNARYVMAALDEKFGCMNWQRTHSRDNSNCVISVWDENKKQWISREDTGTESFTEAEKGLASDSFKRAAVNWGIGRELYTAGLIWVEASQLYSLKNNNGKWQCHDRFSVKEIGYDENGNINLLTIVNDRGNVVFVKGKKAQTSKPQTKENKVESPKEEKKPMVTSENQKIIEDLAKQLGTPVEPWLQANNIKSMADMTPDQAQKMIKTMSNVLEKRNAAKEQN